MKSKIYYSIIYIYIFYSFALGFEIEVNKRPVPGPMLAFDNQMENIFTDLVSNLEKAIESEGKLHKFKQKTWPKKNIKPHKFQQMINLSGPDFPTVEIREFQVNNNNNKNNINDPMEFMTPPPIQIFEEMPLVIVKTTHLKKNLQQNREIPFNYPFNMMSNMDKSFNSFFNIDRMKPIHINNTLINKKNLTGILDRKNKIQVNNDSNIKPNKTHVEIQTYVSNTKGGSIPVLEDKFKLKNNTNSDMNTNNTNSSMTKHELTISETLIHMVNNTKITKLIQDGLIKDYESKKELYDAIIKYSFYLVLILIIFCCLKCIITKMSRREMNSKPSINEVEDDLKKLKIKL